MTPINCVEFSFDEIMPGQSREATFDLPDPWPASEFKVHVMRNYSLIAQSNLPTPSEKCTGGFTKLKSILSLTEI